MMYCRWCGKETARDDSVYCRDCGRDLRDCPHPAAVMFGEAAHCSACGAGGEPGYLYCTQCGRSLETADASGRSVAEHREEPVQQQSEKEVAATGPVQISWANAALGAGAAAAAGIAVSFVVAAIIGMVTAQLNAGMPMRLSPLALWVNSHLPSHYLGLSGDLMQYGFSIDTVTHFSFPVLSFLAIPLVSLWIGSLVSTRDLDRDDFLNRARQGLIMGGLYAGWLVLLSLFTGFRISGVLPFGLFDSSLSNLGVGVTLRFQWLTVLSMGVIWGVLFGVLTSTGWHGLARLAGHYAGEGWDFVAAGVGRALLVSFIGGTAAALLGLIFVVSTAGFSAAEGLTFTVLAVLLLPNVLVYGLSMGGGAAFKITSNLPDIPPVAVSFLTFNEYFHWSLFGLLLLVFVSLLWGGYRAAQQKGTGDHWRTGFPVAAGYGVVISLLALVSQFKAKAGLGELSEWMEMLGAGPNSFSFFAGTSFWATLLGLLIIGTAAASLGAFLAGRSND